MSSCEWACLFIVAFPVQLHSHSYTNSCKEDASVKGALVSERLSNFEIGGQWCMMHSKPGTEVTVNPLCWAALMCQHLSMSQGLPCIAWACNAVICCVYMQQYVGLHA